MNIQTMLEEICRKWQPLTSEGKVTQTKAFLKSNPFIVNEDYGNMRTEEKKGFIVIELADMDSFVSNPQPRIHKFDKEEEAITKVEELYPGCSQDWREKVCVSCIVDIEVFVGKRNKDTRKPATGKAMVIDHSHEHIRAKIQAHMDLVGKHNSSSTEATIPFCNYSSLEEITSDYMRPVTNRSKRLAKYIQRNHAMKEGSPRLLTDSERMESTAHSSSDTLPKLIKKVGLRVAPDPDFVSLLYSFFYPGKDPTIGEVIARSHHIIAENFEGENPSFRTSLTSEGKIGVTPASDFRKTVRMMTKYHFTTQPILDPITGACIGSLNLEQMVGLIKDNADNLPSTLDLEELRQSGILGPRPPMLDENASISLAEALFARGCQAVLFEHRTSASSGTEGPREGYAELEEGLHIMTPVDIVAYITE
jgi:hypothetical protein